MIDLISMTKNEPSNLTTIKDQLKQLKTTVNNMNTAAKKQESIITKIYYKEQ